MLRGVDISGVREASSESPIRRLLNVFESFESWPSSVTDLPRSVRNRLKHSIYTGSDISVTLISHSYLLTSLKL